MTITTGRFGVDQKTGDVTEYVPPNVIKIGNVTPDVEPEGENGSETLSAQATEEKNE